MLVNETCYVFCELPKLMGYRVDGTDDDYRTLGREIPFVALKYR